MNVDERDVDRGLYDKFEVSRVDGRDGPGDEHEDCSYFPLDLDHDPHALPALVAYAKSAEEAGFSPLAADLISLVHDRSPVDLWRVTFEGKASPPAWVWARDEEEAGEHASSCRSYLDPTETSKVSVSDYDRFTAAGSIYPTLMRRALESARDAAGEFAPIIYRDGAARISDGSVVRGGSLAE